MERGDPHNLPTGFEREWPEILDELRVVLPGVQLLFAFLLAAPFTDRFSELSASVERVYLLSFLAATAACAFLVAPSVYHRLHWRHDVRAKERMLRTCNRLAITGGALLALAMTAGVHVVVWMIMPSATLALTALTAALFAGLWFVLPLLRRRSRRR
jgi:hypothetical protein